MLKKFHQNPVLVILLALALGLSTKSWGQKPKEEDNACVLNLERANEMYREGKIDLISDQLTPCLTLNRLNKENRVRAYRLLIITELYFNEKAKAVDYMTELLKLDPEYEINENLDPTEFIQLYNQFRTQPIVLIGLTAGGNFTYPFIKQNFSLDNVNNSLGEYQPEIGYKINFSLEVPLFKKWAVQTGVGFQVNRYSYEKSQFSYSNLSYDETQSGINLPVNIRYYLSNSGNFSLYMQAGAALHYLIDARATLSRIDSINVELGNQTVAGPSVDMTSHRTALNLTVNGAIGFRWKGFIGPGYLLGEVSYSHGLWNQANSAERYNNPELIYDYNYIDNDFTLSGINVMIGYALPIYRPKIIERKNRLN